MNSQKKVRIDGFRMPQALLESFYFLRDKSVKDRLYKRPPASAYATYITLLKQLDIEKNQRGILKEYNLAYWSKKLNIPYTSLYTGMRYLEKYEFVKEEIHNGFPVLVVKGIEKYTNPPNGQKPNYLLIPNALLETNILAEFVHASNPEGIELIFSLLNQYRTALGKKQNSYIINLKQSRLMSTLKKQLNKTAKKVREILRVLEPLFIIEYNSIQFRKHQIWVNKVWISLREECIKEQNPEDFKVDHLTAALSHELTYFLDGHKLNYKPRDQIDVMIAFKQEIYNKVKIIKDDSQFRLDSHLKRFFLKCMDDIGMYIQEQTKRLKTFKIRSIGGLFRSTFRNNLGLFLNGIPYRLRHDAKVEHIKLTGELPEFAKYEI